MGRLRLFLHDNIVVAEGRVLRLERKKCQNKFSPFSVLVWLPGLPKSGVVHISQWREVVSSCCWERTPGRGQETWLFPAS